jgi:probable phosphoglycerate mutase
MIGSFDWPLSEEGLRQAYLLAESLKTMDIDILLTSPLLRARRTAEIISGAVQLPSEVVEDFREIDLGLFEGLTSREAKARYPRQWEERGRDMLNAAPPGGESYARLSGRVLKAFDSVSSPVRDGGGIAIVAHRAVIQVLMTRELGISPELAPTLTIRLGEMKILPSALSLAGPGPRSPA